MRKKANALGTIFNKEKCLHTQAQTNNSHNRHTYIKKNHAKILYSNFVAQFLYILNIYTE